LSRRLRLRQRQQCSHRGQTILRGKLLQFRELNVIRTVQEFQRLIGVNADKL
jgi:hypothetical protein